MVESDTATSGELILRLGGMTHKIDNATFGEIIEVDAQIEANAGWTTGSLVPNVYTTTGTGFPWTVYIKDLTIS